MRKLLALVLASITIAVPAFAAVPADVTVGEHWGGAGHWESSKRGVAEPEELYWRYWVKFPDGFISKPPTGANCPDLPASIR